MRRLSEVELGELRARAVIEAAAAQSEKVAAAARLSFWSAYATEPPPGMVWGFTSNGEIDFIPEVRVPKASETAPSPRAET